MDRKQAIQRQFGATAALYAASRYHRDSPDLEAMVAAADLRGDEWLLDVGTGAGHTAVEFAPRVAQVVALDLTEPMLAEAAALAERRGLDNVRCELGDAMRMPFAAGSFDVVTCRVCAHHFADAGAAVDEMSRVLRPGGQLLLVDSVSPEDAASDTFLNCIEVMRDPSHVRNYTVSQWLDGMRDAGLSPSWIDTFAAPLDFEDWCGRMKTPEVARAQLRAMFDDATDAIRDAFNVRTIDRYGFDIPIGLFSARKPGPH